MPVTIERKPQDDLRIVTYRGVLTRQCLLEARQEIYGQASAPLESQSILDLRAVEAFDVDFVSVMTSSDIACARLESKRKETQVAVLVRDDLGFGMARMLKSSVGLSDLMEVEIFFEESEAQEFLAHARSRAAAVA